MSHIRTTAALSVIATLAAGAVSSAGCGRPPNEFKPPGPPEVFVSPPMQRKVQPYFKTTGITAARRTVDLRPRVSGNVVDIHFTDGQRVVGSKCKPGPDGRIPADVPDSDRGTLLFEIDPRPYQVQVDQARATVDLKQAVLSLAETELAKKEDSFKKNGIAELEVIRQRAEAARAKADLAIAAAALRAAELELSYTKIHAPIDGRISQTGVNRGDLVGPSDPRVLATIVQDQPIYVHYSFSDREVLGVMRRMGRGRPDATTGPEIPVDIGLDDESDYPHHGRYDYADPMVDQATGTYRFRAIYDNKDGMLVPGLYVKLRIRIFDPVDALLVPERAIGTDQTGKFVLVVGDKDVVEQRTVVPGSLEDDGMRVIIKGLAPTDRVIVNGIQRARPGATVVPKPAPVPPAPKTETKSGAAPAKTEPKTEPKTDPPATTKQDTKTETKPAG